MTLVLTKNYFRKENCWNITFSIVAMVVDADIAEFFFAIKSRFDKGSSKQCACYCHKSGAMSRGLRGQGHQQVS